MARPIIYIYLRTYKNGGKTLHAFRIFVYSTMLIWECDTSEILTEWTIFERAGMITVHRCNIGFTWKRHLSAGDQFRVRTSYHTLQKQLSVSSETNCFHMTQNIMILCISNNEPKFAQSSGL
jgi:hypothetical protein